MLTEISYLSENGFSFIELCIVIAIVVILVTIAYPNYSNFVLKSHRSDAIASLLYYQAILERCYSENFSYAEPCKNLPNFPINSSKGYYQINLSNLTATTYLFTAQAIGRQNLDKNCINISIDENHHKISTRNTCWAA